MPLYRQVGIFGRDGVDLDRSTLCDWAGITAWWLKPLWELMVSTVPATSPKLFCDDTHLPVMAKGKTLKGALFGYARDDSPWDGPLPPAVVYVYTDGRKHSSPLPQLAGFSGVLQVDGWRGFKALAASRDPGAIILAFCRVGGGVAIPAPHRPGRADFPHPVLRASASLRRRGTCGRSGLAATGGV